MFNLSLSDIHVDAFQINPPAMSHELKAKRLKQEWITLSPSPTHKAHPCIVVLTLTFNLWSMVLDMGSSERGFGSGKSENRRKNKGGGESGASDPSQGPSGGSEPV